MHHSDDRTGQLSRLYPDLVSAGGLVTALVEGSRRRHLNLDIDSSDDLNKWPYAVVRTLGGYLSVNLGIEERWFLLAGWRQGVCLVHGKTQSLTEVADAASAWSDGHTLHQLKQRCSFIDYSELAEDHERGPAQAVAQQWLNLLRVGSMPHTAAVLQEAYARPELRELFAFTSHWAVHFSRCTGYPYTWDIPWIEPLASGDYRTMSPSPPRSSQRGLLRKPLTWSWPTCPLVAGRRSQERRTTCDDSVPPLQAHRHSSANSDPTSGIVPGRRQPW